jgi:hypothetical protein
MATRTEIEAIKRKLAKQTSLEAAITPDWPGLAAKSNKGLKKSQANSRRRKEDALLRRLPGAGWTSGK